MAQRVGIVQRTRVASRLRSRSVLEYCEIRHRDIFIYNIILYISCRVYLMHDSVVDVRAMQMAIASQPTLDTLSRYNTLSTQDALSAMGHVAAADLVEDRL
jgi:hypothetical protein